MAWRSGWSLARQGDKLGLKPTSHVATSLVADVISRNPVEIRTCIELPHTDLQHSTVKSTLYDYVSRGPNFLPDRSATSRFPDTKLSKIENALNWPQNYLEQKYFHPFSSTTSGFGYIRLSKIRNAPNNLRLSLKLNCRRYPEYNE